MDIKTEADNDVTDCPRNVEPSAGAFVFKNCFCIHC